MIHIICKDCNPQIIEYAGGIGTIEIAMIVEVFLQRIGEKNLLGTLQTHHLALNLPQSESL